jgi:intein/homing endonuclease
MPKHISKEDEIQIIEYYKTRPMTLKELCDKFNLCNVTIIKILNKYNVKRYSKTKLFSPHLDEHYFENINNEEKAYFLGLIVSDGCIYSKNNKSQMVTITLQDCDKYILERFVKCIKSNKNITSDGRGCSEIQILSDTIVDDLRKYGLFENKSLCTVFPKNLPKDLYRHFIRGLIDGDGSISFYNRQNRYCHVKAIRFCQGNKKFVEDFIKFLHDNIGTKMINVYQEKENLWSCAYRANSDMILLINYLYKDATIYLTRKKEKCDLIYKEFLKYKSNS